MMSRRDVLVRGLAGLAAGGLPPPERSATGQDPGVPLEPLAHLLAAVRLEMTHARDTSLENGCRWVDSLRAAMRRHLRAYGRFPAYFDVGQEVWVGVYDWLVATEQPPVVLALSNGRDALRLVESTLVLRPDLDDQYMSEPYEVAGRGE